MFSKYAWVGPIKDIKGTSTVNAFKKIISEGRRKPNKIWIDQGSEFYSNSFKDFFKPNNIEIYSTYNEGKLVVAERFMRTLKNKIFKHMTAISKNFYFDVLDDIFDKYNNTVHRTINMKPIDVTADSYAEYNEDFNKKDPKFKVGDHVRISKYKKTFAKGYTPNWSEELFFVRQIKNTVSWTYVVSHLNGEKITGSFYEKELQKNIQEKFRIEKVLKRKNLIVGLIKKVSYKIREHFPKSFRSFRRNINVKVDLSNYATTTDLKNVTHVDTSTFALTTNLAILKTEVDKLDINKLAPVSVDLSKLSDVVKNDVVKKTVYDKLVAKVINIDTNDFVLKTKYNTDKTELEKKIPNVNDFVKNK